MHGVIKPSAVVSNIITIRELGGKFQPVFFLINELNPLG